MQTKPGTAEAFYEVELTTFAYGGEVMGRLPDGRAVFVPFALPGEKVRVRLVEEKRSHARAQLVEVLRPAVQRQPAACVHFGLCGGCHYQHMPYEAQLIAKTEILRDQLKRIGRLEDPPVQHAVACPHPYGYRNHVQFHLTTQGRLGYYPALPGDVFAIQECHLPESPLQDLWPQLDFEAMLEIERIGLRLGAGEDIQLILESQEGELPEFSVEDLSISAVHLSADSSVVLAGSESVIMEVLGRPFRVSAGSFFQVNTEMAEAMVEHVLEHVPEYLSLGPQTTLLDVYCGVGLFSAFLAPHVGRLIGIEAAPSAVEDFAVNLDEFENVELYQDAAENVLSQIAAQPEFVLVDPPRSGLEKGALENILRLKPRLLVYVSCDPATLGRDARRLAEGGYHLKSITPFDLFPQTYHIESISFWVPAAFLNSG
jgi:23S rRNA (uracil1939-C5)-methyltransferase